MKKYLMISAIGAFGLMASDSYAMDRQFHENRSSNLEYKQETVKDSFIRNQKVNERLSKPKVFLSKVGYVPKKIWTNAGKIWLSTVSINLVLVPYLLTLFFHRLETLGDAVMAAYMLALRPCRCSPKIRRGGWQKINLLGIKFWRRVR